MDLEFKESLYNELLFEYQKSQMLRNSAPKHKMFGKAKSAPCAEARVCYDESNDFIKELEELNKKKDKTFQEYLFELIDKSNKTDVEVYKNAGISKQVFSNLRSDKDYKPRKKTVIQFALSLNLNLDDTLDLLKKAGFTLSNSNLFDIAIKRFIENKIYDVYEINDFLYEMIERKLPVELLIQE